MIEEATAAFVKEVGIPVAAFVLMYWLYVQTQKWQQKQDEKTAERFDKLVECFVNTTREITEAQNNALIKHTEALERHTSKLEEHVKLKDEFIEYIKNMERRKIHG